jgi:tuftelin-interacting protein 11
MRESTFGQLLEEKFFPAWLETLHFWLVQPNYSAGEVASWYVERRESSRIPSLINHFHRYHYWKDYFAKFNNAHDEKLTETREIDHGFRTGLKLMNEAMSLGAEAPTKLAKPDFKPLPDKKSRTSKPKSSRSVVALPDQPEVTFRTIAEQHAAEHNLLFVPTGKSHSATGKQLFKVSKNFDGKGGVTVYVGDDAVYAMMEDGAFRAVLLNDMVKMANK